MAYGISKNKMTRARHMAAGDGMIVVHGNKGAQKQNQRRQYDLCVAFWDNFFDGAQRPNDEIRLFPANLTFHVLYEDYFIPWCHWSKHINTKKSTERLWHETAGFPSESTFRRARHHENFKDVKVRPKHYHARCLECTKLTARRLKGFVNEEMRQAYDTRFKLHEDETRTWHQREELLKSRCRLRPDHYQLLTYDDTSSWGCPSLGNRPPKNLTTSRLKFVPFHVMDYAEGDQAYVYTVKGRYHKGGNRLCTTLYHVLRRSKQNADLKTSKARHLTLVADNFSDNKCNTVFQFAAELVWRGWFDVIEFEFGPT